MRLRKIAIIMLILALILSGCAKKSAQDYQDISAKDLYSILQNEKDFILVDVREPDELTDTGFIPDAVNIPLGQIEQKLSTLPKTGKLIVYCKTGNRSAQAAKFLVSKGYPNVYNLEGGIERWPYEKTKSK